jgi:predicted component of type VI protein secretion system
MKTQSWTSSPQEVAAATIELRELRTLRDQLADKIGFFDATEEFRERFDRCYETLSHSPEHKQEMEIIGKLHLNS